MAHSKTAEFSEGDIALAEFAKAIAHPARIAILKILAERDSCICGELVDELPLSQSTVSQHLKALKEAGLIQGEIEGPKTCYCLNPDGVANMARLLPGYLEGILKGSKRRAKCC